MKRITSLPLVLSTLVIGCAIGFFVSRKASASDRTKLASHIIGTYEFDESRNTFETLRTLRSGNTNQALTNLEDGLDGDIIGLYAVLKDDPRGEHSKSYRTLLNRIQEYRVNFPHKTADPKFDAQIAEILAEATRPNP